MAGRIEVVGKRHRISYTVKIVLSTIVFAVIFGAVRSGLGNPLYDCLTIGYFWSAFRPSLIAGSTEKVPNVPNIDRTYEQQAEEEERQGEILFYIGLCVGWAIYLTGAFLAYSLICCMLDRVVIRMERPPGKRAVRLIFFIVSLIVPPVLGILFSDMVYERPLPQFIVWLFPRLDSYKPDGLERAFEVTFYIPVFGLFVAYVLATIYNFWMLLTPAYVVTDSEEARSSLPQRLAQSEAADSLSQRTAALEEKVALLTATIEKLKKGKEGSHTGES